MTNESRLEQQVNKAFRPYSNIPTDGSDYDFEPYLGRMQDNLRGPLRQFRSRILDLINLICVTDEQRRVARDQVFSGERDMTGLFDLWCQFYNLGAEATVEAIRAEHAAGLRR